MDGLTNLSCTAKKKVNEVEDQVKDWAQNVTQRQKNIESKRLRNMKFRLRRCTTDLFRFPEQENKKRMDEKH